MPVERETIYRFGNDSGTIKGNLRGVNLTVEFSEEVRGRAEDDYDSRYQTVQIDVRNLSQVIVIMDELKRAREYDLQSQES